MLQLRVAVAYPPKHHQSKDLPTVAAAAVADPAMVIDVVVLTYEPMYASLVCPSVGLFVCPSCHFWESSSLSLHVRIVTFVEISFGSFSYKSWQQLLVNNPTIVANQFCLLYHMAVHNDHSGGRGGLREMKAKRRTKNWCILATMLQKLFCIIVVVIFYFNDVLCTNVVVAVISFFVLMLLLFLPYSSKEQQYKNVFSSNPFHAKGDANRTPLWYSATKTDRQTDNQQILQLQ